MPDGHHSHAEPADSEFIVSHPSRRRKCGQEVSEKTQIHYGKVRRLQRKDIATLPRIVVSGETFGGNWLDAEVICIFIGHFLRTEQAI